MSMVCAVAGVLALSKVASWLKEAINTIAGTKTSIPAVNLVLVASRLGSTRAETACVVHWTVEELQEFVLHAKPGMDIWRQDRLACYVQLLWWWHCARMGRESFIDEENLTRVHWDSRLIWEDIPRELRDDWCNLYLSATNKKA